MTRFAEALGITPQQLNHYVSGRMAPGNAMQARLRELGCNIEWLMTGEGEMIKRPFEIHDKNDPHRLLPARGIRLLGKVGADPNGKQWFEPAKEEIYVPFLAANGDRVFALIIEGDSMIHARKSLYPGDIAVFEVGRQPKNGDIVAVHLNNGERLVKILKHLSASEVQLSSANNFRNYPAVKVKKSHIQTYGIFVAKLDFDDEMKRRYGIR